VRGSGYVKNASLNFLPPLKRRFLKREEQSVTREGGAGVHTQTSHLVKEQGLGRWGGGESQDSVASNGNYKTGGVLQ
jgi:hypothetical protein